MNVVLIEQIKHLSETKTRFEKIKQFSSNWRAVIAISLIALTLKVCAEQLALAIIRHQ